jgi:transcriptional regulator with XRE-family HTH domain
MAAPAKPRSFFGHRLRAELERNGTSIREVARRLNPGNVEFARRNLTRWITGGVTPTRANRQAVAVALGLDPSFFDEDDEEEAEMADLVRALMHRIDRVVEDRDDDRMRERA